MSDGQDGRVEGRWQSPRFNIRGSKTTLDGNALGRRFKGGRPGPETPLVSFRVRGGGRRSCSLKATSNYLVQVYQNSFSAYVSGTVFMAPPHFNWTGNVSRRGRSRLRNADLLRVALVPRLNLL